MLDGEAVILQLLLAAHLFEISLPALSIGRIGEHEVELFGGRGIRRER